MRHLLSGIVLLLTSTSALYAQNVGIGTTNPQNKLHVAGGVRIDTLASDSGLVRHTSDGVLYTLRFTGNSQDVLRGNGSFQALEAGSGGWQLAGNANTDPGKHFIGTSDDKPLLFRINNTPSGLINRHNGNTAFGYHTLHSTTTGNANTAMGFRALYNNTTGVNNVALGYMSLFKTTTGSYNTATGLNTLYQNSTGGSNTAYGYQSLYSNTTGNSNVAIGRGALYLNTTADDNTAVGVGALYGNTTGTRNVSTGTSALINNNTGNENTANGTRAMYSNTTGSGNIAMGTSALYFNTEGHNNTAAGLLALHKNTTGMGNVALGSQSLITNTTGTNNTALGTGADVTAADLTNATALGYGAKVTASNKVRIGNAAVTAVESFGEYTKLSDGRYKFNVQENVKGLEFILKLRPVTYQLDARAFETKVNPEYAQFISTNNVLNNSYTEANAVRRTGFIAQEVESAATSTGYLFNGIKKPATSNDHYSLSYETFVVPLVKAVQEQQALIDQQNKKIEQQELLIAELVKEVKGIKERVK